MIEGRIREYEAKLALSEVIDPLKLAGDRVKFGATITIEDTESGDRQTFAIVGEREVEIVSVEILDIGPPDEITSNTR